MNDSKKDILALSIEIIEKVVQEYSDNEQKERIQKLIENLRGELYNLTPEATNGGTLNIDDPEIEQKAKTADSIFSSFGKTISNNILQGQTLSKSQSDQNEINAALGQLRDLQNNPQPS